MLSLCSESQQNAPLFCSAVGMAWHFSDNELANGEWLCETVHGNEFVESKAAFFPSQIT